MSAAAVRVRRMLLKDAVSKLVDGSHNPPAKCEAGVPMLSARNIENGRIVFGDFRLIDEASFVREHTRTRVAANDVLLTIVGTIGRTAVVPAGATQFALQRSVAVLTPCNDLLSKFLCYQLQAPVVQRYFQENARGTAQKGVYLKTLGATPIWVPTLEEQSHVVAEIDKQFSRLDEAAANLQRVKANLKRYRNSVLNQAFSASPSATLDDLIDDGPQNGLYLPKDRYGTGVPILRIDDYQTDWLRPVNELRRVRATEDECATWGLSEGDLLINRVNSLSHLGKCIVAPSALAGAVFESNMMRMRLRDHVLPRYVELYLASRAGKRRLTQHAKWAVNQASINQKDVRATPIHLPDLDEQRRVVAEVDSRLSILRGVETEVDANLKRAQALRQSVLANAFQAPQPNE